MTQMCLLRVFAGFRRRLPKETRAPSGPSSTRRASVPKAFRHLLPRRPYLSTRSDIENHVCLPGEHCDSQRSQACPSSLELVPRSPLNLLPPVPLLQGERATCKKNQLAQPKSVSRQQLKGTRPLSEPRLSLSAAASW